MKKIIIVAGEESGDMYAAKIINDFSKEDNIKFYGMEICTYVLFKD